LPSFVALASGCSGSPDSPGSTEVSPPPASGASASPSGDATLQTKYLSQDVRHTFRAKGGDTIDCVDFFAEPGVKALAARGTPLASPVALEPRPEVEEKFRATVHAGEDVSFNGESDEDGNARSCPAGTVPELRLTQVRGADQLRASPHRLVPVAIQQGSDPADGLGYGHVVAESPNISAQGTYAALTIPPAPFLGTWAGDHSLGQTWTFAGSLFASQNCTAKVNCYETVEVGWDADPSNLGDGKPRLFIFSTNDGYSENDDCWQGSRNCGGPADGTPIVAWVPNTTSKFAVGQALPSSVPGAGQSGNQEIAIEVLLTTQGWQISLKIGGVSSVLGYYALSNYSLLHDQATTFEAGGEVFDGKNYAEGDTDWVDPPNVQMGMGGIGVLPVLQGHEGYNYTAVVHDYEYFAPALRTWVTGGTPASTRTTSYTYTQSAPVGPPYTGNPASPSPWRNFFYFGDVTPFVGL
jgi:hypothetical protein